MAFVRSFDLQTEDTYLELQRLSNLYTNGNKSAFLRKSILESEEKEANIIDLETEIRSLNKIIKKYKEQFGDI